MLRVKMLTDELHSTGYGLIGDEKMMGVLGGLD